MAALLLFLKANWKWIAVLVAVLGLVGYIKVIQLERDHYHQQYVNAEAQITRLVDSSKIAEAQSAQDAAELTDKYKSTLATANTLVTENARLNAQNIAKDKELAAVKLSLNAVRMFNASKQSTAEEGQSTTTVSGNDGSTAATAKALEEKSQQAADTARTLADLLQVVNINDANHLKCIKTVEEWQSFWKDYSTRVEALNNAQPR